MRGEDSCAEVGSFFFLLRDDGCAGFWFSAGASIILPLASDLVGYGGALRAILEDLVMPE